jgi:hypothetical protein
MLSMPTLLSASPLLSLTALLALPTLGGMDKTDKTISSTGTGTGKSEGKWDAGRIPDLSGRIAVVTGANSGIGFAAAVELARAGAHVVFAVRDLERGRAAAAKVSGSTEVRRLDLADLASVR